MKDVPAKRNARAVPGGDEDEQETYYDAIKAEMGARAARTAAGLADLEPMQRISLEGFRPGTYLRLRFTGPSLHPGLFLISSCSPALLPQGTMS